MKKRIIRILVVVVVIYVVGGIALYFLQDKLLFHPTSLPADHVYQFNAPFKEVNLPYNEDRNLNIIQFEVPDSICRGVVLYFHGNRDNVSRYAPAAVNFTRNGYEVWMPDYPGFGKSTGKRSEARLYEDAMTVYQMARRRFGYDSVIIYGRSIGTGIASYLASKRPCRQLILETPYYSVDAMAKHYFPIYPVVPLTEYAFPTYEYLQRVASPVTIFHGTNDRIIPYKQSKRLMELKQSNLELVTIEGGGHNNLNDFDLFRSKIDSLLRLR